MLGIIRFLDEVHQDILIECLISYDELKASHIHKRDAAKPSLTQPFKLNHTNQVNREIRMLHISCINRYAIVIHSMLHTLVSFCFCILGQDW